jgi:hypothetical protein
VNWSLPEKPGLEVYVMAPEIGSMLALPLVGGDPMCTLVGSMGFEISKLSSAT